MMLEDKLGKLNLIIEKMDALAVAFSGGVDSTFLLKVAKNILGGKAAAITVRSAVTSKREMDEALDFAKSLGVKHVVPDVNVFDIPGFSSNPVDRCYLCKKEVFKRIFEVAHCLGIRFVADGSNVDDLGDYRPGMRAVKELGVVSPLRDAGLTKADIRSLSREMGLPSWDKPAYACLASRIPYGERITAEKLDMVEKGEQYLWDLGFKQVRVRHHGDIARIEVAEDERRRLMDEELLDRVHDKFKEIGFEYSAMDLKGYRTGSLNEVINKERQ